MVEIDGAVVGTLRGGEALVREVSPGQHRVRVKFRTTVWSNVHLVSAVEGQEAVLVCRNDRAGYPSVMAAGPDDLAEMRLPS
jgi:hypothetical protein